MSIATNRIVRNYDQCLLTLPDGTRTLVRYANLEDRYRRIQQETRAYWAKQEAIQKYKGAVR